MTLLLTECSSAGIVMAADSAITYRDSRSRKLTINETGWLKVLKAPKINSVVGYWGEISQIHGEFDQWIQKEIVQVSYSDLPSLVTALADSLNKACRDKPLADDQCAGLHVAGFHDWHDKKRRPVFFHVHNGPELYRPVNVFEESGTGRRLVKIELQYEAGPRALFEPHQDFPSAEL